MTIHLCGLNILSPSEMYVTMTVFLPGVKKKRLTLPTHCDNLSPETTPLISAVTIK
jgi:hypothetical protein